jgi:hypothetical protein
MRYNKKTNRYTLSKKDKLTIYENALLLQKDISADVYDWNRTGLCFAITYSARKLANVSICVNIGNLNAYENMECTYPEVFKFHPAKYNTYWFDMDDEGMLKRINILETVIKQLKKKKR